MFSLFQRENSENYAESSSQRRHLIFFVHNFDNFPKITRKCSQDAADADFIVGCDSAPPRPDKTKHLCTLPLKFVERPNQSVLSTMLKLIAEINTQSL